MSGLLAWVAVSGVLPTATPLQAAPPPAPVVPEQRLIEKILIVDAERRPQSESVVRVVRARLDAEGIREGRPFDPDALRKAEVALRPLVEQFAPAFDRRNGELLIAVAERPVLKDVRVVGNRHFTDQEVFAFLEGLSPGTRINRNLIIDRLDNLRKEYRSRNYYFVAADFDRRQLETEGVLSVVISEGPRVRVRKIEFEGARQVSPSALSGRIDTSVRVWPFLSGALEDDRISGDVQKLTEYLQGEGYLNARVGRRIEFLDAGKSDVSVVFTIHEGVRFKVGAIRFTVTAAPDKPTGDRVFSDAELRDRMSLAPGRFYTRSRFEEDLKALQDAYGAVGRFRTRVNTAGFDQQPPARDEGEGFVDLIFRIEEASQVRIGNIEVVNNRETKNRTVLRVLRRYGLRPGDVMNTVAMREARQELEDLGIFAATPARQFAVALEDLDPVAPDPAEPDVRDLRVDVNETVTRSFSFGVGFNTNFGVLGNITYTERNFDITDWPDDWREIFSNFIPGRGDATGRAFTGAGERFSIDIRPGLERSAGRISWRTPYFGDRPFALGADGYATQRFFDEYDEFRGGGSLSIGKTWLGNTISAELSLRPEVINLSNIPDNPAEDLVDSEGTFLEVHLTGLISLDRRKRDLVDRTAGWYSGDIASLELTPTIGTRNYFEVAVRYNRYFTTRVDVDGGRDILMVGGRAGYIFGDVPVFDRYFGGGVGTLRGFEFRGASPRQGPNDDVVGGKFLLIGTADYSFPLLRFEGFAIRGFGFVDVGTVERDFGLSDFRMSVGPGVRVILPLLGPVPIEAGIGIPVIKNGGDQTSIFFISAGVGF